MSEDRPKIYCGTNEHLPDGYDDFGTPYACLRKGVGVGLYVIPKQRQQREVPFLKSVARELGIRRPSNDYDKLIAQINRRLDNIAREA